MNLTPEIVPFIWFAVIFSSVTTSVIFIDILKSKGWWFTDSAATEGDVFRVVHHLLFDARDSTENHMTEIVKRLKTDGFHNQLEIKTAIRKEKAEIIAKFDELLKKIDNEKID